MPPRPDFRAWRSMDPLTALQVKYLLAALFTLIVFMTTFRGAVTYISRRKRRMSEPTPASSIKQEKKSPMRDEPEKKERYNEYLQSLREETREPGRVPIWPWTTPPQMLPGPFDALYYPLPPPTRHEHTEDSPVDSENGQDDSIESSASAAALRVSALNVSSDNPNGEQSSHTSTQGWRRHKWSSPGG